MPAVPPLRERCRLGATQAKRLLLLCLLRKLGTRLWDWLSIKNQQLCGNFKLSLGGTLGAPLLACSLHACCLELQRKAAYMQLLAARMSLLMHGGLTMSSAPDAEMMFLDMRLSAAQSFIPD